MKIRLNWRDWLGIVIALCISFIFLYASEEIDNLKIKSICDKFATIVGVTGIVTIIVRRYTLTEIIEAVAKMTGAAKDILDLGIRKIYMDFRDVEFNKEIKNSSSSIDVFVIRAHSWLSLYMPTLVKFAERENARLRFCFLNPESDAVGVLQTKFRSKNLKSEIESMIEMVSIEFSQHPETKGKVSVFIQDHVPQHCIYRMDDKIFLIPYNIAPGRGAAPVFCFEKQNNVRTPCDHFVDDYEDLIDHHAVNLTINYPDDKK
jgi:hypothetical protein